MIKELNYYLKTNRFSQIAEDIDNSVRKYASSFGENNYGDFSLRENARLICEQNLIKSGICDENNSFINVDLEFFENGELVESNLNRFIKDILKAHGYQKILWEYMGTTGLMTEVSKNAMETDGFKYENFLPAVLKQKEIEKQSDKINRNFNRLKDESGFNWKQSYDPNYTVSKNGWMGAFDENNIWNYYQISDLPSVNKSNKRDVSPIKIVKIEKGCLLYDADEILLNPIILWYLTHGEEVYGGEESDTAKIVESIGNQMNVLGVDKITQVSVDGIPSKSAKEIIEKYKEVLGTLADSKIKFVTDSQAKEQIIKTQKNEESTIIQNKSFELQNKIEVLKLANPEISFENLISALSTEKTSLPLNIIKYDDAVKASFSDEEYYELQKLIKLVESAKKQEFIKVCTNISSSWEKYKTCGKSKIECINLIYNYIAKNEETTFTYEKYLKDILIVTEKNHIDEIKTDEIASLIDTYLPDENREFAKEYIASLPEQKTEVYSKVINALRNAIINYIVIRSSTGMSIKELFNYAVKSSGGILSKTEYIPITGYITPGMQTKVDEGNKRIFFEKNIEELISELVKIPMPTKEVNISELQKEYTKSKIEKPVVVIGNARETENEQMIYDSGFDEGISPVVLAILKTIKIKSFVQSDTAKKEITDSLKAKIVSIAKKYDTQESFVEALKKECNIEYNFSDSVARQVFSKMNIQVTEDLLTEYVNDFEETAQKKVSSKDFIMSNISNIEPIFKQVAVTESNLLDGKRVFPSGLKLMESTPATSRGFQELSVIQTRHSPVYLANDNDNVKKSGVVEQNNGVVEPVETTKHNGNVISLIETILTKTQKAELLHICNNDLNIITPLLVKEYLWRKNNKKSIKNIVKEVQALQNISSLPTQDLEIYLKSQNFTQLDEYSTTTNSEFVEHNTVANRQKFDEVEKKTDEFETNIEAVESVGISKINNPIKLTTAEKQHFRMDYGLPTEGISPVIKEYIQSGEWKTNRFGNVDGVTASVNGITGNGNHSYEDVISGIGNKNSGTKSSTIKVSNNKAEHVNVDEPYSMSPELKETFKEVSRSRRSTSRNDSSSRKEYIDSPINAFTNSMSPEEVKMSRINANYEHDKAVLAKSDPVFAKNQFWDVGHAEESGDLSERDVEKLSKLRSNDKIQIINKERE